MGFYSRMKKMKMNSLIQHIILNSQRYFFGVVFFLLLLASQVRPPSFDGSFESAGLRENRYIRDYRNIDSLFQDGYKVLIEVVPNEVSLAEVISDLKGFEKNLKPLFDTISVRSVLDLSNVFYSGRKRQSVTIQTAMKKFVKVKLFRDLISKDQKSFLVVLGIEADGAKVIVEKIDKALAASSFDSIKKMNITSPFHIEEAINKVLLKDLLRIIWSVLFAFILIMLIAYRSFFSILYLVITVLISLLSTFFVFQLYGKPFNMITLMVLPVVIVLSVADGIHLLTGMSIVGGSSLAEKVKRVYQKYATPSLLTSVTTAVAFFSLSVNDTESIVHLGQIAAIAITLSFVSCYLVTPFVFIKWFKPSRINRHFFKATVFFEQRPKFFTYLLLPLLFVAIYLLPQLQFKNDFEIFLPLNSEAKTQHDEMKANYYSQIGMELVFTLRDTASKDIVLTIINDKLKSINGVELVRSIQTNSFVRGRFLLPIDVSKFGGFKRHFETNEGLTQRFEIKVKDPNIIPLMEHDVRAVLNGLPIENILLSSTALIFDFVNKEVAKSLIQSLVLSTLFLTLVFYYLTRNWVKSLIGLLANLIPLSVIFIIFVGFELNINIVTAVTAVICLGLIVDDTIHAFYRKVVRKEPLKELGFGMLTTTLILTVGFGLFSISSIKPIIIFGLICSVVFIVTLISDFTLLLHLLDKYDRYVENKKNKS